MTSGRAGYEFALSATSGWHLALEVTPGWYERSTRIISVGFQIGWQHY